MKAYATIQMVEFQWRGAGGPTRLPHNCWYAALKTIVEPILALVLLVLAAPLLALAAVVVKLTSPGPAFYSQVRLRKSGRPFSILKVRTMYHNCENFTGPQWAPHDLCITPLGHFLRRSHLDELPQLWNVVRGEMSLVGPRPERPEFMPLLERTVPDSWNRLAVRPGITGLAQVNLSAQTSSASLRRKLAYDLYYIERLNPWLDLRILLCTASALIGIPFSVSCKLLRIPNEEAIEHLCQNWAANEEIGAHMDPAPA